MTQDEIIEMAKEAWISNKEAQLILEFKEAYIACTYLKDLEAFAKLVAAKAIAELESQEPVGRFAKFTDGVWRPVTDYSAGVPLYAHPPQRTEQDTVESLKAIKQAIAELESQEPYALEALMYSNDRIKVDPVTGNVSIGTPQRQLESTTDMMMELADRLGELPEDIDPRAWGHLLVYVPKRTWVGLTNKDIIEMWPETSTVGWDDIRLIEAKLKEKNT